MTTQQHSGWSAAATVSVGNIPGEHSGQYHFLTGKTNQTLSDDLDNANSVEKDAESLFSATFREPSDEREEDDSMAKLQIACSMIVSKTTHCHYFERVYWRHDSEQELWDHSAFDFDRFKQSEFATEVKERLEDIRTQLKPETDRVSNSQAPYASLAQETSMIGSLMMAMAEAAREKGLTDKVDIVWVAPENVPSELTTRGVRRVRRLALHVQNVE